MKERALEQRVEGEKKQVGPYEFFPLAYIQDKELIISLQPEPDVETTTREMGLFELVKCYLLGEEKPNLTREKLIHRLPEIIERIQNVRSFDITEKDGQYLVEYE